MLTRLPVKRSYLAMAWDATAKGQNELAVHFFKMAYEQETEPASKAEAAWNIYVAYKKARRFHEAYLWCERTASNGLTKAMRILGKANFYGLGIETDYKQAARWFKAGAEHGDPNCMRLLGECYISGRGVSPDDNNAYECFRKAYDDKEQGSYYWIGLAYMYGVAGYVKDPAKAIEIWKDGQADCRCLFELGKCYYWGKGVRKDPAEALCYFKKVSERNRSMADSYLTPDKQSLRTEAEADAEESFSEAKQHFCSFNSDGASSNVAV